LKTKGKAWILVREETIKGDEKKRTHDRKGEKGFVNADQKKDGKTREQEEKKNTTMKEKRIYQKFSSNLHVLFSEVQKRNMGRRRREGGGSCLVDQEEKKGQS